MPPRISALLLSTSLVLSVAFAAPSAANPQLDELNEALSRQLGDRVEAMTAQLAAAALERQTQKLLSLHAGEMRVAEAPNHGSQMTCAPASDGMLHCVVVAGPATPGIEGFAAAQR